MIEHTDATSQAEIDDLSKLLDGLVERPVRAIVVPALEKVRGSLHDAMDVLGTLGEAVDEQRGQLVKVLAASDAMQGQMATRFDLIEKQLASIGIAQVELCDGLLLAIGDGAQRAEASASDQRRQSRLTRIWTSSACIAVVLFTLLIHILFGS